MGRRIHQLELWGQKYLLRSRGNPAAPRSGWGWLACTPNELVGGWGCWGQDEVGQMGSCASCCTKQVSTCSNFAVTHSPTASFLGSWLSSLKHGSASARWMQTLWLESLHMADNGHQVQGWWRQILSLQWKLTPHRESRQSLWEVHCGSLGTPCGFFIFPEPITEEV